MKIGVWKTGHEIADTVAEKVFWGFEYLAKPFMMQTGLPGNGGDNKWIVERDTHIGYGILRGMTDVFKASDVAGKPWLHIDRGYFNPGHFDGYYRVSLRGTQQTTGLNKLEPDYDRLNALNLDIKPWRGFDQSKPVLVCPPTDHVMEFFKTRDWLHDKVWIGCYLEKIDPMLTFNAEEAKKIIKGYEAKYVVRDKGDPSPINFNDYSHVMTFNSSVGWQALAAGIPCLSNSRYSIVGAYFADHKKETENLANIQEAERNRLFGIMASLQLTLDEMRAGKIYPLIQKLLGANNERDDNQ